MLKSDEILNSLNAKLEQAETCVDLVEKEELINQAVELKKEYKTALEDEAVEINEINNKMEGGIVMNNELNKIEMEEKVFLNYIKGIKNEGMVAGENGAVIPQTIADRIIKRIYEISPVLERMTKVHEKGDLVFIREKEAIPVGYQEEMVEFAGGKAEFETVKLESHLIGALAKVSKSLINRAGVDVVGHVCEILARDMARFLEGKALNGDSKIRGLADAKEVEVTGINLDGLIDAMAQVPAAKQANAVFVMHPSILAKLRKEKANGALLLAPDARMAFGMAILGKEVLVSDQMPLDEVYFGDMAGATIKVCKEANVEVLRERYADMYALGIVATCEADIKVIEPQAIVKIKVGA